MGIRLRVIDGHWVIEDRKERTGMADKEQKREDYDCGEDAREDLRERLSDFLGPISGLAAHWQNTRKKYALDVLSGLLPLEMIDILDSLSDINLCCECEVTCRAVCHEDWDFCYEHGKKLL